MRLNLIEKVCKSMKRSINQRQFVKDLDDLAKFFREGFERVNDQLSFATGW